MKPSEILSQAGDLVAKGWTQGAYARDAQGESCASSDPEAACFCATGAVRHVCPVACERVAAWPFLRKAISNDSITLFNDHPDRTQAQVVKAFRKAAKLAEETGQ